MKNLKLIFATLAIVACGIFMNGTTNAQNLKGACVCPMVYAPVCTYDGKEFSNACIAECRGYTADEYESCGIMLMEASSAQLSPVFPPYACPDVYDPVCTYDGKKFGNSCYASLAGYSANEYYSCGAEVY